VDFALDDFDGEAGGVGVEALTGLDSEEAVTLGVGEDFWGGEASRFGGQSFEGVAELVGAGCARFFLF